LRGGGCAWRNSTSRSNTNRLRSPRGRCALPVFTPTGSAHHAADALSRFSHQPVLAQPVDPGIPVLALDEERTSLIEEIPIVMAESLFEHQCRDQMAQRIRENTSIDPMWDSDQHVLLVQRLPSGALQVHVYTSISRDGPCSIVTPVAEDGSDLRREESVPNRKSLSRPGATVTPRLLTRLPIHGLKKEHVHGWGYSLLSPRPLTRRRRRYPPGRRTMSVHSPQPISSRSKQMIRNARSLRPHRPSTGYMTWMTGEC
jgi:hypothetical protein